MNISKKEIDWINIVLFLIFISLPLGFKLLGLRSGEINAENKKAEVAPHFHFQYASQSLKWNVRSIYINTAKFINQFDRYFRGSFSFRQELLAVHNIIKLNVFHTNPIPDKVIEGEHGWFFPGDSHSNAIKELKGLENFSTEEVEKLKITLTERSEWLMERNIQFYLAVAPDKLSVYGKFLPIKLSNRLTKLQQLKAIGFGKFNVIDLKEDYSRSDSIQLFLKTDTHWNDYGAFIGYRSLMKKLAKDFPTLSALKFEDFSFDTRVSYQQDLTKMLSIKRRDEQILLTYNYPSKASYVNIKELPIPDKYDLSPLIYEIRYKSAVNNLKVLIFRDSFTSNLEKYLIENFGESVFIWQHNFNREIIEKEKPDIVLHIIVEREIDLLLRENW